MSWNEINLVETTFDTNVFHHPPSDVFTYQWKSRAYYYIGVKKIFAGGGIQREKERVLDVCSFLIIWDQESMISIISA